jgi:hypothetical protein
LWQFAAQDRDENHIVNAQDDLKQNQCEQRDNTLCGEKVHTKSFVVSEKVSSLTNPLYQERH